MWDVETVSGPARTGRGVAAKKLGSGRDRHLGPTDRDDKPKRANGVGEGRPPWLSAFPVDGGVLSDCIGVGDLEMVRNDLADGEG